jgi:hypothetical protein
MLFKTFHPFMKIMELSINITMTSQVVLRAYALFTKRMYI